MKIVILGLSVTSSWGNGHATTYRGLMRGLAGRGHEVLFLERDVPWYADNRDLRRPPYGRTELYTSLEEVRARFTGEVAEADAVIVGSYVQQGVAVGEWVLAEAEGVTAFYDIDTPITLAKLAAGDEEYLAAHLIPRYQLYLSFTGGPTLRRIEKQYGSPCARALYCSFDPALYYPDPREFRWDLGYLGTYSADRQPGLEELLLEPARRHAEARCVVAGPQYPASIVWPRNVERLEHLAPAEHRGFYNAQRFTLNLTRREMVLAGYSPSVRLFEAAACGVPILTDDWSGLETFFEPGREVLVVRSAADTMAALRDSSDAQRQAIGEAARQRVLRHHTSAQRAAELEQYILTAGKPEATANDAHLADPPRPDRIRRSEAHWPASAHCAEGRGPGPGRAPDPALAIREDSGPVQQSARTRGSDG